MAFPLVFLAVVTVVCGVASVFYAFDARDLAGFPEARATAIRDAVLSGLAALVAAFNACLVAAALWN